MRGQRKRDRSDPARWEEAAHGGGGVSKSQQHSQEQGDLGTSEKCGCLLSDAEVACQLGFLHSGMPHVTETDKLKEGAGF